MNYRIEVIDTMEAFGKLSKQWNDLLALSRADTIFLTWEWLYSWAETFMNSSDQLYIITVYDNEELIGIAPWIIRRTRFLGLSLKQIEFLGTPEAGSDYLDVIILCGKEKDVSMSIHDFIFSRESQSWDCLLLRDIPANSFFLLHLTDKLDDQGKNFEYRPSAFCPLAVLPSERDMFFKGLSTNRREQFHRHLKVIGGPDGAKHETLRGRALHEMLESFFILYAANRGEESGKLKTFLMKYLEKCSGEDNVQMDVLCKDESLCAGLLHLKRHNTLSMYLMAVDKTFNPRVSVGNVIVGLSISRAIAEGDTFYDFLKGTEPYKFHWANSLRSSLTLVLHSRKPASILLYVKNFLTRAAKIVLR
jgi:hypothetical protein